MILTALADASATKATACVRVGMVFSICSLGVCPSRSSCTWFSQSSRAFVVHVDAMAGLRFAAPASHALLVAILLFYPCDLLACRSLQARSPTCLLSLTVMHLP